MNRKDIIEQEVKKTLQCFGQLDKLPANPFFHTRLQKRLKNLGAEGEHHIGLSTSRLWRPVFIGIIIILNLTTALLVYMSNGDGDEARTDTLTVLAVEYGLTDDNADFLNNNE